MYAKKSLGQNFLVDRNIAARIVGALAPRADETIIEIGPGRGALTAFLVASDARVVAIEYDRDLIAQLKEQFGARENFVLVENDALTIDYCALVAAETKTTEALSPSQSSPARLISNLPYNISTAVLQRLIAARGCLSEMVLMLQREVVERIVAPPCTGERGYLSVLAQMYCEVETLFDVAPGAFRPAPKVWSGVIKLRPRARAPHVDTDETLLKLVSAGFAQRRKTLANNLRAAPPALTAAWAGAGGGVSAWLAAAGIAPERRAETLTIEEWIMLAAKSVNAC